MYGGIPQCLEHRSVSRRRLGSNLARCILRARDASSRRLFFGCSCRLRAMVKRGGLVSQLREGVLFKRPAAKKGSNIVKRPASASAKRPAARTKGHACVSASAPSTCVSLGPKDLEEIEGWLGRVFDALPREQKLNVMDKFRQGVELTTDYSGSGQASAYFPAPTIHPHCVAAGPQR